MGYHLRVKVCGVTSEEDALAAARFGADAVGLNFHPPSPRCVDPEVARFILRALPPFIEAVGVFVDRPLREVYERLRPLGRIRTIQMHGQVREMADCYPYHFVPAFQVRDASSLAEVTRYLNTCRGLGRLPSAVLLDGHAPGLAGGTGRTAPWELLASFRPGVPVILAGGLTPDNVAEAVALVRPFAVDVASGVESSPGVKDPDRVQRFIENARAAAGRL
jgi:phosphoribosylanthranilate isomerase